MCVELCVCDLSWFRLCGDVVTKCDGLSGCDLSSV